MRGLSGPRILAVAIAIVLISVAKILWGMPGNVAADSGCTSAVEIRIRQGGGSLKVQTSCPQVGQLPDENPSKQEGKPLKGTKRHATRCPSRDRPVTPADRTCRAGNHPGGSKHLSPVTIPAGRSICRR